MLVPFGAAVAGGATAGELEDAFFATVTYLLIYAFMNLGAFAVVDRRAQPGEAYRDSALGRVSTYAPGLAGLLALFFLSLAGIPPLAGWFAKFVMFRSVMSVGGGWAIALAVIAVHQRRHRLCVLRQGGQVGLVRSGPRSRSRRTSCASSRWFRALQLALGVTAIAVLFLGIYPTRSPASASSRQGSSQGSDPPPLQGEWAEPEARDEACPAGTSGVDRMARLRC